MYNLTALNISGLMIGLFITLLILLLIAGAGLGFGYFFIIWWGNRDREKKSLDSTLIQVTLPRDNEIKIDAAEQFFASFAGIKASGNVFLSKI